MSAKTDRELMRQALDALEQHDNPQRWPFAVKQDSRAVIAALRARLAEPVQTTADVPEANCGKLNAMQEGRGRYTNKASIMAFVEGAWWAAQQLAAPGAAPTAQPVAVPEPRGFLLHWPAASGGRRLIWDDSRAAGDAIGCPVEPVYSFGIAPKGGA